MVDKCNIPDSADGQQHENTGDSYAEKSRRRATELEEEYEKKQQGARRGSLPLQRELAPPKLFPLEALGPLLGPVARRIHEVVKAPDSICGQSVLAAAALATQPYADVHIDGRVYPLSLFFISGGESGDRKSAVDAIALKPVRDYEKMLAKTWIEEKGAYKNKVDVWKKQREQTLKEGDPSKLESALGKLEPEPERPLEPFLLLEEPTYEGLIKLLAVGQPSLGLFSDEGGRMLGGHAMSGDNLLKTSCGLSSLWDGRAVTRVRGGDDNLLLFGRRLSLHLMIQEPVLMQLLKNEMLVGQGLLARCLIVFPVTTAGRRPYNPVDLSKDPLMQNYQERLAAFLDRPFPLASPDIKNELNPRPLVLTPEAMTVWILCHDDFDRSSGPKGVYRAVRRWASKAAEQVLRIAGVLTLIDHPEAGSISTDTIERAIVLVRFYLDEIVRIADMSGVDPDLELAQAVLDWMKVKAAGIPNKTFSLREIYQNAGPRGVRNKKTAEKVMRILEEHGEIVRVAQDRSEWQLSSFEAE